MEAHLFRDRTLAPNPVPVEDLRSVVSQPEEGEWLWVDAIEPSADDLTALQKQLDLHDLAVEDVQQRDQRHKLDLYPGHAFAVFRPLSLALLMMAASAVALYVGFRKRGWL